MPLPLIPIIAAVVAYALFKKEPESDEGVSVVTLDAAERLTVEAFERGQSLGRIVVVSIGGGYYLREDAAASWRRLKRLADGSGVALKVTSAFRFMEDQVRLYAEHIAGTRPQAVARPGYSTHQQGDTVDVSVGATFSTPVYLWLKANAPAFGWTNVGAGYNEPWHWRYSKESDFYA